MTLSDISVKIDATDIRDQSVFDSPWKRRAVVDQVLRNKASA